MNDEAERERRRVANAVIERSNQVAFAQMFGPRTKDLPPPTYPSRVVTTADGLLSARYSFETQADGHFWRGRAIVHTDRSFMAEAVARSPERAIAMALILVGEDMLKQLPQFSG